MKNKPLMFATLASAMLVLAGCNKPTATDEYPTNRGTNSPSLKEAATNAWQKTKETATNAWAGMKEEATNAWANTKEATTNAWANVKDSVQSATDYTYDKKAAYVAKAQADLDALDAKIKEMSDKAATANDSVKADAQAKIQALRDKRAALDQKLDAARNSTESGWNDVKNAFKNGYDDVKDSFEQAWQWLKDKMNS